MATSDRDDAIAFLRTVMDDSATSMANRIKAAEAIVRASSETPSAGSDVHSLDDGELLARARGIAEGGDPPREGPKAPGLSRDPSQGHGGDPQVPPSDSPAAYTTARPGDLRNGRNVPRETPLTAKRDPKGPDGTQNGPANSIPIAPNAKNGQPLEPWE